MLRRVALVKTDISEERTAYIIMVARICELGTKLAVTSNRSGLRKILCHPDDGGDKFLRYIGSYNSHTAQHPRRLHS
jgi:hypothetical protein